MEWEAVWKITLSIIVSFGGAGAIIAGITKFASEMIAKRLEKKYELKLSKELEAYKTKLEGKSYVSKARFDAEFQIYRQLSEATVNMVKEVSQLFPKFTRDSRTDYDTCKAKHDLALDKIVIAQDILSSSAPFISGEIYSLFNELESKCKIQLSDFIDFRLRPDWEDYAKECKEEYKAVWQRTTAIQNELDTIVEKLRVYLSTLDVVE